MIFYDIGCLVFSSLIFHFSVLILKCSWLCRYICIHLIVKEHWGWQNIWLNMQSKSLFRKYFNIVHFTLSYIFKVMDICFLVGKDHSCVCSSWTWIDPFCMGWDWWLSSSFSNKVSMIVILIFSFIIYFMISLISWDEFLNTTLI